MDPDADEVILSIPQSEAAERACAAFRAVFEDGPKIELGHYVVYFTCEWGWRQCRSGMID